MRIQSSPLVTWLSLNRDRHFKNINLSEISLFFNLDAVIHFPMQMSVHCLCDL